MEQRPFVYIQIQTDIQFYNSCTLYEKFSISESFLILVTLSGMFNVYMYII